MKWKEKYSHPLRGAWHQYNKRVRDGKVKTRDKEITFEEYIILKKTEDTIVNGSLKSPWQVKGRNDVYKENKNEN